MVHRWRVDARQSAAAKSSEVPVLPKPGFIALDVRPEPETAVRDIRIELRRGSTTVVVHWSVESASACAAWLHEWLR